MRTAWALTIGGVYLLGGVPAWGVYLPGGTCPGRGCTCHGGVPAQVLPLWTEWQTGAKILPCPKLRLRAVIKQNQIIKLSFCGVIVTVHRTLIPNGCIPADQHWDRDRHRYWYNGYRSLWESMLVLSLWSMNTSKKISTNHFYLSQYWSGCRALWTHHKIFGIVYVTWKDNKILSNKFYTLQLH